MTGLLINGADVTIPGVTVLQLGAGPGDGRHRTNRPSMVILHKTIADDPEHVIPGRGPPGGAERTAAAWRHDPTYSGAHLIVGHDGVVGQCGDLVTWEAYHATVSNSRSIGIEICEVPGGGVYETALRTTVALVVAICEATGIQLQVDRSPYTGHPLKRMLDGGSTMVGVFGHRSNTERRGRWDPGDLIWQLLRARGAEAWDFAIGEDGAIWKGRQLALVAKGRLVTIDGVPGPQTTAALRAEGYPGGVWALGLSGVG